MKNADELNDKLKKNLDPQAKQPGSQAVMQPHPELIKRNYKGSDKLLNKVVIITGGDSGIGSAVAILFSQEGADVVISYLNEDKDALYTKQQVEQFGRRCLLIKSDIRKEKNCQKIINKTLENFGRLDILINNAAEQHEQENFEDISAEQLLSTFSTNVFSIFYLTKAALPYLKKNSTIINTTSITAYKGNKTLMDYSSTKGAIVSLTRSLSLSLIKRGIRVNAVAPGPIWTPLIPASFSKKHLQRFGDNVPMKRAGQPYEVASCFLFLASDDAAYISGQVLHPNGGEIING